ncbi:olfactory receptor 52K1-like [Mus caroli]|uniref:Olfactory receptor 52K1-like n=1 Tax=Mus caroli TaxID=10089 RepID=A0A6P5Q271_MUSCR|nr:olfactory receptor 52K1-like [Mus caroli]
MSGWSNGTYNESYTSFLLMGFPGMQEARALLVLPFLSLYLVILFTNALVIHTVASQRSLHQPMYLLIALLLAVNICAATTVVPPMLFGFSTRFNRISLPRCLGQMFCIYLSCGDISLNKTVGLTVRIFNRVLDMFLLGTSYSRIIHAAFRISSGGARSKALNTCGSHLLVIFTVYSSTMSSSIVYRVARTASQDVHNLLSAFYLLLPCLVNPIIYGARTKEIRQHLVALFQRTQQQVFTEKPQSLPSNRELPG